MGKPDGAGEQEPDVGIFFVQCPFVTLVLEDSENHLCISNIHLVGRVEGVPFNCSASPDIRKYPERLSTRLL